jgi:hypothetical protein
MACCARAAAGPRLATNSAWPQGIPSVICPRHSWTQLDIAGLSTCGQDQQTTPDLQRCKPGGSPGRIVPLGHAAWQAIWRKPLTRLNLAHHWPTATGSGLPDRSQTRRRPGPREYRHRA